MAVAAGLGCFFAGGWFVSQGLEGYETGILWGPSGGGNGRLLLLGLAMMVAAPFVSAAIVRPPRRLASRFSQTENDDDHDRAA